LKIFFRNEGASNRGGLLIWEGLLLWGGGVIPRWYLTRYESFFLYCWSYSCTLFAYVCFVYTRLGLLFFVLHFQPYISYLTLTLSSCVCRCRDSWQKNKEFLFSNRGWYRKEHYEEWMQLLNMNFLTRKSQLDKQFTD
jgi:hypothetical protein